MLWEVIAQVNRVVLWPAPVPGRDPGKHTFAIREAEPGPAEHGTEAFQALPHEPPKCWTWRCCCAVPSTSGQHLPPHTLAGLSGGAWALVL